MKYYEIKLETDTRNEQKISFDSDNKKLLSCVCKTQCARASAARVQILRRSIKKFLENKF